MSKNDVDLSNLMYKSDDNLRSSNVGTKKQQTIELPENIEKLIQKPKKEIKKKEKPQQPTEDEVIQKRRLKEVLQQYLLTFPEKLKTFKKINLEKQDLDQLKDLETEMDFCISNNANIKGCTEVIFSGINAFEYMCVNFTPLQNAGLHEAMKNDPDTVDTIKHLCLKNLGSMMMNTKPEHRLLYKILTTSLSLHAVNSFSQNMYQHNENVLNKINLDYSDL
jgi:hypothetical protein